MKIANGNMYERKFKFHFAHLFVIHRNRYRIKESERGHRTSLSKTLNEPTKRLDTSIILPRRVYDWI
jgi:hypothetical protein